MKNTDPAKSGRMSYAEAKRIAAETLERIQPQVDAMVEKFPKRLPQNEASVNPPGEESTAIGTLTALVLWLNIDKRCGQTPLPA